MIGGPPVACSGDSDERGLEVATLLRQQYSYNSGCSEYMSVIDDQSEWKDTEIPFKLSDKDSMTEIRFTHADLVPEYECFDVCSNVWASTSAPACGASSPVARANPNRTRRGALPGRRSASVGCAAPCL
jgi:hypothetical protein